MENVNEKIAELFCGQCNATYTAWTIHIEIFDKNSDREETIEKSLSFFNRIYAITASHLISQISKFHDPAKTKVAGKISYNLSIDYIIDHGDWSEEDKKELKLLKEHLDNIFENGKRARNKLLSHNDLDTFMNGEDIGCFDPGMDLYYFGYLGQIAGKVSDKWIGKSFEWDNSAKFDTEHFLNILKKSPKLF